MAWSVQHILALYQLSEADLNRKILKKKAFGRAIMGIQLRGQNL